MKARRWFVLMMTTTLVVVVGVASTRSAGALRAKAPVRAGRVGSTRSADLSRNAIVPLPGVGLDATSVIAQRGFGDTQNSYAWGMTWFNGKLYVGTGRDVVCVERETSDYYYPFAHRYAQDPEPSVHCPKNPLAMNLRAEIWQYTPQTGVWRMVYRAPLGIVNPLDRRQHLSPDIAYRGMQVVRDPQGHDVLFVSGVSADEYVPQASIRQPPRLLRSYDGAHFQNIAVPLVIHRTGQFTNHRAIGFRGIVSWRGGLYVLASTGLTGDGAVVRVDNPWSAHTHFTQVSPPWLYVFELQTFHGDMYFGAGQANSGYSVWRLWRTSRPYRLQPIVTRGAGRGHSLTSVVSMQVYRHWLYVAAVGWYCVSCHALPTTELIRIAPSGHWQVVVGNPRFVNSESRTKHPISGLGDGFDNIFNSHMWRIAVSGNAMYVGTLDWSWLLQEGKSAFNGHPGVVSSLLAGELGFDIWATCDGRDFFPVTRDAFGVDEYDFGVRTLIGQGGGFYVGSADHAHGSRIYHTGNVCASFAPAARAASGQAGFVAQAKPTPPQRLMTDTQRDGTVLSWNRAAHASRYQVMRAAYVQLPYSFQKPIVFPGGFTTDDAVPVPAAPGSPGSATTTIAFPGAYTALALTSHPYFVDGTRRRGAKYSYQVEAVAASGARSIGSNVQVVPDPRPAATFSQLDAAVPTPTFATVQTAAGKSGCAGTLATLARLARTAGSDDARDLADRLARRLEYRNLAGGPATGSLTCG